MKILSLPLLCSLNLYENFGHGLYGLSMHSGGFVAEGDCWVLEL